MFTRCFKDLYITSTHLYANEIYSGIDNVRMLTVEFHTHTKSEVIKLTSNLNVYIYAFIDFRGKYYYSLFQIEV